MLLHSLTVTLRLKTYGIEEATRVFLLIISSFNHIFLLYWFL